MESTMNDLRHRIRFIPETTEIAVISYEKADLENYQPKDHHISGNHVCLIENESHTGCSMVVLKREGDTGNFFEPGSVCVAVIGKLAPMQAQVKWRTEADENIYRVGIELLG